MSPPPQEEIHDPLQEEIQDPLQDETEEETQDPPQEETQDPITKTAHSPRRKRSRNVRNSTCSCCIGPSSKKSKHVEERHRPKRLTRQQKHFIRDMLQLVSLRNKILKLLLTLFPTCAEELNRLNVDTDSIDSYIDQIINAIKTPDKILFADDQADICPDQKRVENVSGGKELSDRVFLDAEYPSLIKSPVLDEQQKSEASNPEVNDQDTNTRDMPVLDKCELFHSNSDEDLRASQEKMSLTMCSSQTLNNSTEAE
ncbi:hypothetical protein FSP39_017909 [Pinctada imbricata]|uniref:Uncharacterized protein n=1 Tax=Pinctada imbricata TaxID=66713 RepID=A0AA88XZY4_PINIB|nr:hypothetical protein FSP39_017909 [Pinctada imbricata]